MEKQQSLEILQKGVEAWNYWRKQYKDMRPDLHGLDLNGVNLSQADLSFANLNGANLSGANLSGAKLNQADLSFANLSGANLWGAGMIVAKFQNANLSKASLRGANLISTDFSYANLRGANLWYVVLGNLEVGFASFKDADLSYADLNRVDFYAVNLSRAKFNNAFLVGTKFDNANLIDADFSDAEMSGTSFGDRDLRIVKGLESVQHRGPSPLSINTLYLSGGDIPEDFLRGTGASDSFIEYARALTNSSIQYYTCFISYSSKDQLFAEQLHAQLQSKGIRCWFAPEDLKIGEEFPSRIEEAIRLYDKLLVILSENSVKSPWVEDEVRAALEKEERFKQEQQHKTVLFPIKIDNAIEQNHSQWVAMMRRKRHIGDFTQWRNHDKYLEAFKRLLRDLQPEKS